MQPPHAAQNLTEESPFNFACHDALPCFTQCCKDVNIYLTPYDTLRLRQALQIGSSEFLAKYTRSFLAKAGNIPVVQLLMDSQTLCCPFVSEEGCRVYENRPWACRMFPLDLVHLLPGFGSLPAKNAVRDSSSGPGARSGIGSNPGLSLEYAEMDREYQSVVPEGFKPGVPMNEGLGRVLFVAYDLDRFAELLRDRHFLKFHEIDDGFFPWSKKIQKSF